MNSQVNLVNLVLAFDLDFIGWRVCATFEICEILKPYNFLAFNLIKLRPGDILFVL